MFDPTAFKEVSNKWTEVMDEIGKDSEAYWNSLSKEDQLKAFCAVSRRIYQAEIVDQGTYRHALYGVFGFGPEAYAPAQLAGYLAIHNSIMASDHDERLLKAFCVKFGREEEDGSLADKSEARVPWVGDESLEFLQVQLSVPAAIRHAVTFHQSPETIS